MNNLWRIVSLVVVFGFIVGCRTFNPTPMEQVPFKDRAETRTEDGVTVSVVVLTAEESLAAFDVKLYKKKIQPVWL